MIRALGLAALLECIIILFLIFQPQPEVQPMRGLPTVDVVTLSDQTLSSQSSEVAPKGNPKTGDANAVSKPAEPKPSPALKRNPNVMPTASSSAKSVANVPIANSGKMTGPPTQPVAGDRLDKGVVLLSGNNPVYPKHAAAYNIETEIKVQILVNADGIVQSVTPLSGEDKWGFSNSVRNAVMGWRFEPASVSGYASSFSIIKTFKFTLD